MIPKIDEIEGAIRTAYFDFGDGSSDVPPGENRTLMVETFVDSNAWSQVYTAPLVVTWSGGSQTFNIKLHVSDFTLPATSTLKSSFSMTGAQLCAAHYSTSNPNYTGCMNNGNEQAELRLEYGRFLLDHRITSDVVVNNVTGGSGSYGWSAFESRYSDYFNGDAGTRLKGAMPTTIPYSWPYPTSLGGEWADPDLSAKHSAWWNEFSSKGWATRTYEKICDEPQNGEFCDFTKVPSRAATVHTASPSFSVMVTTDLQNATDAGVVSDIDIMSPLVNYMDDKVGYFNSGNQRPTYETYLNEGGRQLWWYESCVSHGCGGNSTDPYFTGWPSRMIDAPSGMQLQSMEWLSFLYDVSGEHYYDTTAELATAFTDQTSYGGYGDGTLLYPGTPSAVSGGSTFALGGGAGTDIPLASYRLKMIRAGMEAYEYLSMLTALNNGNRTQAINISAPLFSADGGTDFHAYQSQHSNLNDSSALASARSSLRTAISAKLSSLYSQSLSITQSPAWRDWYSPLSFNATATTANGPPRTFTDFAVHTSDSSVAGGSGDPNCDATFGGNFCTLTAEATACSEARTITYWATASSIGGTVTSSTKTVTVPSAFVGAMDGVLVRPGQSATSHFSVTSRDAFYTPVSTADVTMGVSGCPPYSTCTVTHGAYGTGAPTNASVTVSTSSSTPMGDYTVSIQNPTILSPCAISSNIQMSVHVMCPIGKVECFVGGVDGCYVPKLCAY